MGRTRVSRTATGRILDDRDRRILALAFPALGALAIEPLYLIVDTAIVGHLGRTALGGLAVASSVLNVAFWIFHFLLEGVTTQVALRIGAGDSHGAAHVVARSLTVAVLMGAAVSVLLALAADPIAGLFGGTGSVREAAATYLRISALAPPFIFVTLVATGYLRGIEATRATVPIILGANALNVVLELLLVGPLHAGVAGSAWGTVVAQIAAAVWFSAVMLRRLGPSHLRPTLRHAGSLLRIGGHLFVRTGLLIGLFALGTRVAAGMGDETLGAHQIAYQMFTFLALSTDALAVAGQTLTATLLGSGDSDELRAIVRRLTRMSLVVGGALAIGVAALSPVLPHIFTGDRAIVHRTTIALLILALMQLPGAIAFQWDGVLMGANDFGFLARAMAITFVCCAPLLFLVRSHRSVGISGLWGALLVMMIVRAGLSVWRGRGSAWMDRRAPPP